MADLKSIVNECLIQHEGGEAFFDALDDMMRNDTLLITMLIGRVLATSSWDYIITSGTFGKLFKEYSDKNMPESFSSRIITVPGGLRNGTNITPFWENIECSNKKFIFLDDSFYKGRTRDVVKKAVEEHNGNFINTYVFYDGSREKEPNVYSFYRYFDEHPEELNKPSYKDQ